MISFHGVNKPAAESRTWPHEITREGIREQEYVLWEQLPLEHYGALPFTRMVAGHGDFLPGFVRPKFLKNTTAVFQLSTAVIFTSPFICWPDHPEAYLESPFPAIDSHHAADLGRNSSIGGLGDRSDSRHGASLRPRLVCRDTQLSDRSPSPSTLTLIPYRRHGANQRKQRAFQIRL